MPNTAKPSAISGYLLDLMTSLQVQYGLKGIFYGDQTSIPHTPTVCVEPAQLTREFIGAPYRTNNNFACNVLIYNADRDNQLAQQDADLLAEDLADEINTRGLATQMGGTAFDGLVIFAMVSQYDYGYIVKDSKLMRANRLIVTAQSRTNNLET
jgi:hypothetical protein